jgi:hypothetical protein
VHLGAQVLEALGQTSKVVLAGGADADLVEAEQPVQEDHGIARGDPGGPQPDVGKPATTPSPRPPMDQDQQDTGSQTEAQNDPEALQKSLTHGSRRDRPPARGP